MNYRDGFAKLSVWFYYSIESSIYKPISLLSIRMVYREGKKKMLFAFRRVYRNASRGMIVRGTDGRLLLSTLRTRQTLAQPVSCEPSIQGDPFIAIRRISRTVFGRFEFWYFVWFAASPNRLFRQRLFHLNPRTHENTGPRRQYSSRSSGWNYLIHMKNC